MCIEGRMYKLVLPSVRKALYDRERCGHPSIGEIEWAIEDIINNPCKYDEHRDLRELDIQTLTSRILNHENDIYDLAKKIKENLYYQNILNGKIKVTRKMLLGGFSFNDESTAL